MGSQDKNSIMMLFPYILSTLPFQLIISLPFMYSVKIFTWCLAGRYVMCALVIFIGRYTSPFVSQFLDWNGINDALRPRCIFFV